MRTAIQQSLLGAEGAPQTSASSEALSAQVIKANQEQIDKLQKQIAETQATIAAMEQDKREKAGMK